MQTCEQCATLKEEVERYQERELQEMIRIQQTEGKLFTVTYDLVQAEATAAGYREALELIKDIGCMQSKDEEELWCKKDGSKHSIYCPAGISEQALK